jgi:RNA polymerase sigma-70 factor (ECF subfamily)
MEGTRTEPHAAPSPFALTAGKSSQEFEGLAMPLFDSLYNFARWLTHDHYDAEDLVQETYRKALVGFASFELGTNFKAWMFRILKNTFLNSRSSLQQRLTVLWPEEEGFELAVENETPESIFLERSDHHLVQNAIEELPAYFRAPLLLCEVEEMSYQEIATVLSIPIGTVMSRLARARKAIRASLHNRPAAPPSTLAASSQVSRKGSGRNR